MENEMQSLLCFLIPPMLLFIYLLVCGLGRREDGLTVPDASDATETETESESARTVSAIRTTDHDAASGCSAFAFYMFSVLQSLLRVLLTHCLIFVTASPFRTATDRNNDDAYLLRTRTRTRTRHGHQPRQRVGFSSVSVREYAAVEVFDHPHCKRCALSLDWHHTASKTTSIDDYESENERARRLQCRGAKLVPLTEKEREARLAAVGPVARILDEVQENVNSICCQLIAIARKKRLRVLRKRLVATCAILIYIGIGVGLVDSVSDSLSTHSTALTQRMNNSMECTTCELTSFTPRPVATQDLLLGQDRLALMAPTSGNVTFSPDLELVIIPVPSTVIDLSSTELVLRGDTSLSLWKAQPRTSNDNGLMLQSQLQIHTPVLPKGSVASQALQIRGETGLDLIHCQHQSNDASAVYSCTLFMVLLLLILLKKLQSRSERVPFAGPELDLRDNYGSEYNEADEDRHEETIDCGNTRLRLFVTEQDEESQDLPDHGPNQQQQHEQQQEQQLPNPRESIAFEYNETDRDRHREKIDWGDALSRLFDTEMDDDIRDLPEFGPSLQALFQEGEVPVLPPTPQRRQGRKRRQQRRRRKTNTAPRREKSKPKRTTDMEDWTCSLEGMFEVPLLRRSARLMDKPRVDYSGM